MEEVKNLMQCKIANDKLNYLNCSTLTKDGDLIINRNDVEKFLEDILKNQAKLEKMSSFFNGYITSEALLKEIEEIDNKSYFKKLKILKCRNCGKKFFSKSSDIHTPQKFCSDACKINFKSFYKTLKKRTDKYNTKIIDLELTPQMVFEEENYICYICGKKTTFKRYDKNAKTTDDDYANLEHIIPISRGGNHTRDNVHCSCRKCNMEKSSK